MEIQTNAENGTVRRVTALQYLQQARSIPIRLNAMAEQLERLRSAAEYVEPRLSDMPKSATRNVRANEDAIIRLMDYEERMKAQYGRLAEINETINAIDDPILHALLVKRYVSGKPWADVASELYYSEAQVYRLHASALEEVERLIADESI
jgi:chromosome segregation ATPase